MYRYNCIGTCGETGKVNFNSGLTFSKHDLDDLHKEKHLDYRKEDVICDAFFAIIGAIYIDEVFFVSFKFKGLIPINMH